MGHHCEPDRSYIAKHYIREKHTLTLIHKDAYCFVFEDERGTEYYHYPDTIKIKAEHGYANYYLTEFGKMAASCSVGESIYASFYIKNDNFERRNIIFDVRINKRKE